MVSVCVVVVKIIYFVQYI